MTGIRLCTVAMAISLLGTASVGLTQNTNAAPPLPGATLGAIKQKTCLVRDSNRVNDKGESPQIPSTDGDQADLQSRGYRVVPCRINIADRLKFREQVCKVAALNDRAISARFEELFAVRPEAMCKSVSAHLLLP